jgi:NTE family protein
MKVTTRRSSPKSTKAKSAKATPRKAGSGKAIAAKTRSARPARHAGKGRKTINLALQGGGSHGAFTGGVLDRLLEEDRLWVEGISGTSAGALNAAILAQGFVRRGGRRGARDELDDFWCKVSELARFSPVHRSAFDHVLGNWNIDGSPGAMWLDLVERVLSPYQLNPMNLNPLRDLLTDRLDIPAIQACPPLQNFVCPTNVETGHARIFRRNEVTLDALLASACLPFTFQAVEIDGVPYWDGGYMGNPVIFPLIYYCDSRDVAIVQINPLVRKGTPRSATEIANRVNEISFNSSLIAEMRAIAFVQRLIEGKNLKARWCASEATAHPHDRQRAEDACPRRHQQDERRYRLPALSEGARPDDGRGLAQGELGRHRRALQPRHSRHLPRRPGGDKTTRYGRMNGVSSRKRWTALRVRRDTELS